MKNPIQRLQKEPVVHNGASVSDARTKPVQRKHNSTGLPDNLKAGIENLSGHSMDDVKVHYNSSQPAGLQAHAYAQGTDIHLAPGQERHLPHEAWHVVQQKQGRVKPTRQLKNKVPVNDSASLEKEADTMGGQALQRKPNPEKLTVQPVTGQTVQRVLNAQITSNSLKLRTEDEDRLNEAVNLFDDSLATVKTKKDFVFICVKSMRGTNPASTTTVQYKGSDQIWVNIAEWFIRISSVGEILGMLAHEVGVHTLADDQMTNKQKAQESVGKEKKRNLRKKKKQGIRVGLHTHTLSPLGEEGDPRQKDHVNVVKDTGEGTSSGNPRNMAYVETVLRMGDAIEATALSEPEKNQRIHDLLKSFLFDYGRILATDDGKAPHKLLTPFKVFGKAYLISQVMNWYEQVVIRRYAGKHTWLNRPELQPSASGWGLRAFLTRKLATGLFQQAYSTSMGNTIDKGIKTGKKELGKLASPIVNSTAGQYVGGMLGTGAHYGGKLLGGGAHYGGKLLGMADTVLGEGENLAQNVLSLPVSMATGLWGMGKSWWNKKKEHKD